MLALLEASVRGKIKREQVFTDHEDFLAHDDDWLISQFPRDLLLDLCVELGLALDRPT